jgi:predicted TIM-barrel fold metal-dependent hydrolase
VASKYDIVDSQFHLFHTMDATACLAVMDALGLNAVAIDEVWPPGAVPGQQPGGALESHPFAMLDNGVVRPMVAGVRMASMQHPDRFRFVRRIDHRDPELAALVRLSAADPACAAVRAVVRPDDLDALAAGAYDALFAGCAEQDLPVFLLTLGLTEHLVPSFRRFPACRFVVAHIGMVRSIDALRALLDLAEHDNVWLKWSHIELCFPDEEYPFPAAQSALREAVDRVGAERIMWASDASMLRGSMTWADTLYAVRECEVLDDLERAAILGGTARSVLRWSVPSGE